MKTLLQIAGSILLGYFVATIYLDDKPDSLPEYTQEDEMISKYGKPAKSAPETVYVEKEPEPEPIVETVYYDPDHPDVLYSADQIHQCEWGFPTGSSRKAYKPGSQREREWIQDQRQSAHNRWIKAGKPMSHPERNQGETGKRYNPDYEIIPVETGQ